MNILEKHNPLFRAVPLLFFLIGCSSERERDLHTRAQEAAEQSSIAVFSALADHDEDFAIAILNSGVTQQASNQKGETLLMLAAQTHCTQTAWKLLPDSAKNLPTDADGLNALTHAARSGETWLVAELLKRGASPDITLPEGGTLVAESLSEGRAAIASLLVEAGASVESQDREKNHLIEIAARNGLVWMVKDLIGRGAAFASLAEGKNSHSLAHIVAESGRPELIELLASKGTDLSSLNELGESPVHIAVNNASHNILRSLHKNGVSLNQADNSGTRPLHIAIMGRDVESLKELLKLGANPNALGQESKSPLDLALEVRDFEYATLLIQYGAAPSDSMLYGAIADGDRELTDYLLSNGADPNALNAMSDDTPLGVAIRTDNRWAAFRLLKAGAYPNALIREGQTAFHLAVAKIDRHLVALMLENGADPNIPFSDYPCDDFLEQVASENIAKSSLSHTRSFVPLMLAADSGDIELARLLLSHGADPSVYSRGGRYHYWSPISWAARRADVPMMQILLGREPSQVKRRAKIDLSEQRAWVYDGEEEIYSTRVSTGKSGHRTRTGEFVITNRYRNWNSTLYGSSMPYFQRFSCGDFGFHQGYVPGYAASHGCVRVPGGNVRKLWELLSLGDPVEIVP